MQIAIAEAKAKFADLIRRVEAGEPVTITRHGRPVAELRAPVGAPRRPLLGAMKGAFVLPDDLSDGDAEIAGMFDQATSAE